MDFNSNIAVGMTHEVTSKVTDANTALTVGSGSLAVYATPAMAALMERAAAELCQSECPEGWTTVGTSLNITHRAATPTGLTVRAIAQVTAVDGRAISLKVTAYDEREEIGAGTHTRFAVAVDKFMAKAEAKR
ncbi:thioesterase family protein [Selenomonas timonae]|uniref:Thioesterase family protein n=1 Tax=Selenomonas timonae TaxID=2754044 RepID=A0A7G7VM85_9FIRM|nr:thioesterase family protein [Selenomonas timonae]QNH55228.1 thioesterase family protein [Selenomonas timonae]